MKKLPLFRQNLTPAIFAADGRFLSVGAVAQYFDVTEVTIKNWVDRGKLLAARTAGGHRRVTVSSVIAMLNEQLRAIPAELSRKPVVIVVEAGDALGKVLRRGVAKRARVVTIRDDFSAALCAARERPEIVVIDLALPNIEPKRLLGAFRGDGALADVEIIVVGDGPKATLASSSFSLVYQFRHEDQGAMLAVVDATLSRRAPGNARRS